MTMYRRQLIPFHQWGFNVSSTILRDAIVDPMRGALTFIPGVGLFQNDGTSWVEVTAFGTVFPKELVFNYVDESFTGTTINLPTYTFPDPGVITELEGDLIFDVFVGGIKQLYKTTAVSIGQFEIDDGTQDIIFPVALDAERVQIKALIV